MARCPKIEPRVTPIHGGHVECHLYDEKYSKDKEGALAHAEP